jgi:hypothetical protein
MIPDRESERIKIKKQRWLAARQEEALRIDPETAEVTWDYRETFDPYGITRNLPEDLQQIGREYFARWPGCDAWVWFGDLPDAVTDRLWERLKAGELKDDHDESWLF